MIPAAAEAIASRRVVFRSPLQGVPDEAWDRFARIMSVQAIAGVSPGGGVGSFALRPRRLGEISCHGEPVMVNLHRGRGGAWEGDLSPGCQNLQRNAVQQYQVFVLSTRAYDEEMGRGEISRPPGVTRSGALAVLHCGGRAALSVWPAGAFKTTMGIFERTNNLF